MLYNQIRIAKRKNKIDSFRIYTTHQFFHTEYVVINITYDKIVFTLPDIDDTKKKYKVNIPHQSIMGGVSIKNEMLVDGKYFIDKDETTQDELIIYYREQILQPMTYRERMKEKGLTITKIAHKIGVSQGMLSLFLQDRRKLTEAEEKKLNEILE